MYKLTAFYGDTEVEYGQKSSLNLPRAWVKPDWETRRWGYKVRGAVNNPAIMPVSATPERYPETDFAKVPPEWIAFCKDLLAMQKFGQNLSQLDKPQRNFILTAFNDVYSGDKAFNNGHPATGPDPRQESLICAGNWAYILDRTTVRTRAKDADGKNWGKIEMVKLYSFLTSEEPPVVTRATLSDPRVQRATTANRGWLGNFPQLKGVPVLFPFLTSSYHWYPMSELRAE